MHTPGIWGMVIIAGVVILLFGRGKISGVMGEVALGIKAFRGGLKDNDLPQSTAVAKKPEPVEDPNKVP